VVVVVVVLEVRALWVRECLAVDVVLDLRRPVVLLLGAGAFSREVVGWSADVLEDVDDKTDCGRDVLVLVLSLSMDIGLAAIFERAWVTRSFLPVLAAAGALIDAARAIPDFAAELAPKVLCCRSFPAPISAA
jgi:hypothetical protein